MRRWLLVIGAAGTLAAAGAMAQDRGGFDRGGPGMGRGMGPGMGAGMGMRGGRSALSPEDRAAYADARIAALHAGLRLNADQEKLWPPVDEAIRGMAKERADAQQARRERYASLQNDTGPRDIPAMLRFMADRQAASADALRKLADASAPLYASLDEGQKRRLVVLTRTMRPHGERGGMQDGGGWMRRGALDTGRDFAAKDAPPVAR